jgi:glycosyltransferase involved in cell wall biosynthesis
MTASVLHIGKFFPPAHGGMETFLADLVRAQHAHGIDAAVLVHGTPLPDDPDWLTRVPVKGSLLYTPLAPGFRGALSTAIRRIRPDLLHLHLPNPSALWALSLTAARDLPWVVHWHSDVVAPRSHGAVNAAYRLYRPFEQAVLERAERIIVTSPPYLKASEPLAGWRDACAVIPLGLDLHRLPDDPGPAHPDPWPPGVLRLLSIGRLSHYKGYETLVRAVAEMDGVHLVVVGEGESRAELERLIAGTTPAGERPRVTLAGAVSGAEKWAMLAACDVFCLASRVRTEAFGLAVLEAMRYARPCLVSDLPGSGLPWLVQSAGAGRTIPPDDVPAWRSAIAAMGENPDQARAMGRAGRGAAFSRFDIRVCERAIEDLYTGMDLAMPVDAPPDQPMMVIPARDEAETIGAVVEALRAEGWKHIVVIDDQSRDDTAKCASRAGATVLSPTLQLGAWGAIQTGIRYALRRGFRQVVTLDADGQHEPAHVRDLLEAARGSDVVIGACTGRGSRLRRFAWRYFRFITGFAIEDITSGFRCYNSAACEVLSGIEATLFDYQDVGVLLLLRANGLTISEVPVEMNERSSGHSRVFASWWRVTRYMAESTLLCFARWHPKHYGRRSCN